MVYQISRDILLRTFPAIPVLFIDCIGLECLTEVILVSWVDIIFRVLSSLKQANVINSLIWVLIELVMWFHNVISFESLDYGWTAILDTELELLHITHMTILRQQYFRGCRMSVNSLRSSTDR
jgi:hypothetical protein